MKLLQNENKEQILWISLSGLCLLVSLVGSAYTFGIFSPLLSENLGYTAKTLDVIASIANVGSVFVGFGIDIYGIHAVVMLGGGLIFVGLMYIWLAIEQLIPTNPLLIGLFYFLVQTGQCCYIASAVTAAVMLFPDEGKGTTIGLVKGYFSLSTAVLANISAGFFLYHPSLFVLFIAILIPITGLWGVSLIIIPVVPCVSTTSSLWFVRHWVCLFVSLLVLGTFMYTTHNDKLRPFSAILLLLLILSLPMIPYFFYPSSTDTTTTTTSSSRSTNEDGNPLLEESSITLYTSDVSLQDTESNQAEINSSLYIPTKLMRSIPFKEAVYTWHMWALCYILFSLSGAGLMVIYNVNAIGAAVRLTPSAYFISLSALSNGFGRVFAGLVADHIGKYTALVTRLHLLAIVAMSMSITQGVLSRGIQATILPGLLVDSFFFGCTASLISVNVTDIFGPDYVATNFGFIETSPILGSFIFASLIVNEFYSYNTVDHEGNSICLGKGCFEMSFIVSSIACCIAAVLAIYMSSTKNPI